MVKQQSFGEKQFSGKDKRFWAEEHTGRINNISDIEDFPWPDPEKLDFSPFHKAGANLKPGMKTIAVLGKIFTAAWGLMGLENFSLAMYDNKELVDKLIEKIGDIQVAALKRIIELDSVGALWIPDDIAYHTGLMLPGEWIKSKVFTYYKQMAEISHNFNKPVIYHSDGNLNDIINAIIETGFDALHPIEPESMDIYELRGKIEKKLCLIGNIRVHSLATEEPAAIKELVKDRLINFGYNGAYCLGSSNSVPNYVPFENYMTMLTTSAEYGKIS
jgi:uroporphyrinogen decarboxylase